jgi:transporter family protein
VFAKLAVERIDQQILVWGSVIAVPSVYLVYLAASGQLLPLKMEGSGIGLAMLSGVAMALGSVCFYLLLSRERVSLAVPMTSLYPAVTVLLSFLFLREHISASQVLGILCALTAMYLLGR